jgi:hypothetical protein
MYSIDVGVSLMTVIGFLERGDAVSILLRPPSVLEQDDVLKKYFESGHLHLFKGDATSKENVISAWKAAITANGVVNVILFAVGSTAKFKLFKGMTVNSPNVSTMAYFNTLLAITSSAESRSSPPKMVDLSAKAVTPGSMASLPAPVRLFAGWMFRSLNLDKRGMEALVFHGWGKEYEEGMTPTPVQGILPHDWKEQLPQAGWAKSTVLIRPPRLTDDPERAKYRADINDFLVWSISRRDLAGFIVRVVASDEEWREKSSPLAINRSSACILRVQ